VGLLVAVLLGWAMMAIGARKLRDAAKLQADAESRLLIALDYAASQAMAQTQEARVSLNRDNWGEAQSRLDSVNELVTLMERVTPDRTRPDVDRLRDRLGEAQRLVGEQSKDALSALDSLITELDGLRKK
jgi:hypothetical protein